MAKDYHARSDTRIDTEGVSCSSGSSVGRVADLTGQGMRLIIQNATLPEPGDTKDYAFTDENTGHQLTVQGIVRWIRKESPDKKRNELGIEFVNLPPSHRDALLHLAVLGQLVITSDANSSHGFDSPKVDLYGIFDVARDATESEIAFAFNKLSNRWHPDHNNSPEAHAKTEELHNAYSILKDPILRARYDSQHNPERSPNRNPGENPDQSTGPSTDHGPGQAAA